MMSEGSQVIIVHYHSGDGRQQVGQLTWRDRRIFFEYDAAFIATELELSPFQLPLKAGLVTSEDASLFDGLFGVFNDSLPDGWGRLLLDRELLKRGVLPGSLSPLDRLCCVGTHGMGALSYEPETSASSSHLSTDLDAISEEIDLFQREDEDRFVEELVTLAGSSSGARPKVFLPFEGHEWLVKFRSVTDPKDIGQIEYAYYLMAQAAGLDMPEAHLFPSKKGGGFFGVKRFDRTEQGERIHMHSMSGLLHADHRIPSLDYETIMKATLHLTGALAEGEKQFRTAVFNVLSHNRDDHAKNFSFLMDASGRWYVSPAYDLTFSSGPGGEHCSTVMGEGRRPCKEHLLALAKVAQLSEVRAEQIISEVVDAIKRWNYFAEEVELSTRSREMIASHLGVLQ